MTETIPLTPGTLTLVDPETQEIVFTIEVDNTSFVEIKDTAGDMIAGLSFKRKNQ